MEKVPVYKRILSYLYPVLIRKGSGTQNKVLELFLYRGQYQLGTYDALYSDGNRYAPLTQAFKHIRDVLPGIKNVLVLGTGLGSALQILDKMGYQPSFTLVENDQAVLNWALELLPAELKKRAVTVCEDAGTFVARQEKAAFDLVIVDIFSGRVVPGFVTTLAFLKDCRRSLNPGGYLVLNYIINSRQDWEDAQDILNNVFPSNKVYDLGINRLVITRV